MSSNGVMLQDYVPNAINNLTEEIWCAGAVIPAGKRVVIGHIRDGWQEITFTMGKMQDFIGMALVPPEIVGIEPMPPRYGMGMRPQGVAAMMARSRSVPDFRNPTIDQSAPLPPQSFEMPTSPQPGEHTLLDTARRLRMEQALLPDQSRAPRRGVPPYQWGGLHGMMPGIMRGALRGMGSGLGAAGASTFTMTAAQALNDHLVTNSCAGCSDMTSQLRQLTFAFKAAVMTDTGIVPAMNLNMSNALAMTAYGTGTDHALSLVLGASKSYANGPCTDDNGNCLGNLPTPVVPPTTAALEQQVVKAITTAIQQAQYVPQPELVKGLVQGFAALVNQIGFELAKLQVPVDNKPPPPAPPATTAPAKSIWPTIVIGGLIGSAVLAGGALVYTHARRG